MRGEVKAERYANSVWHVPIIKIILQSETYLGHMVQGRTYNSLPEGKKLCKRPKSEWVIVPNTHEPLIDEETFRIVQEMAEQCVLLTRSELVALIIWDIFPTSSGDWFFVRTAKNR